MSTGRTPRIAVFISGGGRSMLNLHDACLGKTAQPLHAELAAVVASRACVGAEKAVARGLCVTIHPGVLTPDALLTIVDYHRIDLVVLAGYLKLLPIPERLVGRIINIHPALLPKFGGPGMYGHHVHAAVIAAGEKVSGCTVHRCTPEFDKGDVLVQRTCPVLPGDTPDTLAARVFEQELIALPQGVALALESLTLK
jgi:phosphoribosylglycinamide formyltransferase-1